MFTYLAADSSSNPAFALVSAHAVLLVKQPGDASSAGDQTAKLLDLWQSLHDSDTAALVAGLNALPRHGFDNFALITRSPSVQSPDEAARAGHVVTIAVGGDGRASINGSPAMNSAGGIAIVEARQDEYEHVLLTVRVDASGSGAAASESNDQPLALPITGGIVRCSAVGFRAPTAHGAVSAQQVPAQHDTAPAGAAAVAAAQNAAPAVAEPQTAASHVAAAHVASTHLETTHVETNNDAQPTNQFDHLFEHTQFFDVESAAVRQNEEADEPIHEANAQPTTRALVPPPVQLSITLPEGSACPVDKPVFIGRRPMLPADADHSDYHLVQLEDRGGGLSRMHVRVDPHKGGAMVTDLASTNGTMLIAGGTKAIELLPNTPHFAKAGDEMRLGNAIRLSFAIE